MKYVDKLLKKLNTDRNTFATYLFTLITAYLVVDRLVEMLLMIFTGVSFSYWGPFAYTLALACPMLAFLFSYKSEFANSKRKKYTLFYLYIIALYIIAISMFTQWLNFGCWLLLMFSPNYVEIITEFSDLVAPAFTSISLYLPLVTVFPMFKWLFFDINDSQDMLESIEDYNGIDLSDKKAGTGPYTCEVFLCNDDKTAKKIVIPEVSRFQSLFVCGGSGTGKTSLIFEPLIARDIERKFFFREVSKEMGFTALKTKIAILRTPYSNEYLNSNFNLNMLEPAEGKETIYKAFMKKMILSSTTSTMTYKNLGLTVMSPDHEILDTVIDVCNSFGFTYNVIDPSDPNSIGLNPFVYDDPSKIAITISSALKAMYSEGHADNEEVYRDDVALQAIENVVILLKEMYPKLNEGMLPNMEDLLKMLTNFDLIEKMTEIMASNESLAREHAIQISYLKKNFYHDGVSKKDTERYITYAIAQLDNLLRLPGVKKILCNRSTNINFDDMLANGDITLLCTRRGDLGASTHKAFGLFFLNSMQNAVLRRPGNTDSRVPHFMYIDEFPDFISKSTESIFTMYRKYKVATTISAQNLEQLETTNLGKNYKQTLLTNCANKIFTGNATIEDLEWWSKEFGQKRKWTYTNSIDVEKGKYDPKYNNIKWDWSYNFKPGKLQNAISLKTCAYKILTPSGWPEVGKGRLNFLSSKYKEPQKSKTYNFEKYSNTSSSSSNNQNSVKRKFNLRNLDFIDDKNEFDPVQTDNTDSKYLFNNNDAIIINLKDKKKDQ